MESGGVFDFIGFHIDVYFQYLQLLNSITI